MGVDILAVGIMGIGIQHSEMKPGSGKKCIQMSKTRTEMLSYD